MAKFFDRLTKKYVEEPLIIKIRVVMLEGLLVNPIDLTKIQKMVIIFKRGSESNVSNPFDTMEETSYKMPLDIEFRKLSIFYRES